MQEIKRFHLYIVLAVVLLAAIVSGIVRQLRVRPVYLREEEPLRLVGIANEAAPPRSDTATLQRSYEGTIYDGVRIGSVDVSGLSVAEAQSAVERFLEGYYDTPITLVAAQSTPVVVTLRELAPYWVNTDVLDSLTELTEGANMIERYMTTKDIAQDGMELPLEVSFDKQVVMDFLRDHCAIYDVPLISPTLSREGGEFSVIEGQDGQGINIAESTAMIQNRLFERVLAGEREFILPIEELLPQGAAAELLRVHDLLGSYTTSFSSSGASRSTNVRNGCRLIDGTTLYPGEEFSAYAKVSPFSTANGYEMAGSYVQGQVVDSLGGGICQVSSTLYNAVLRAELAVTERHNHSMIVTYVDRSADAAIAESSGKDFRFINSTEYPIYIEGYTEGKTITFNIYGVETRPESHSVKYESVTLSETKPETEVIIADASKSVGYVSVQGAHTGYRAELWKVVYEDGAEVSREHINSSSYNMSPRTAVVGTRSDVPVATERMQAAIASGSIDTCKNEASAILAEVAAASAAQAQVSEVTAALGDSVAP